MTDTGPYCSVCGCEWGGYSVHEDHTTTENTGRVPGTKEIADESIITLYTNQTPARIKR